MVHRVFPTPPFYTTPKGRERLLIAGGLAFWVGSSLLCQRVFTAKWLRLGLPVGIGLGLAYVLRVSRKQPTPPTPHLETPPPPLLAYNEMCSFVEPHPLERTGLDCHGPSPLAGHVGVVAPGPDTLTTYASWFSDPTTWAIPLGSYYFYQIEAGYRFHFLGKKGAFSEEIGLPDLRGYISKKETELGISLTPINYPLMVDIQNCLLLKFWGSASREDDDYTKKQYLVEIPKQGEETLATYPLQHTFTVNVICQGLTRTFKLHLSPYQITTDQANVLTDFRDAQTLSELQIEVSGLFEKVLEKAQKAFGDRLKYLPSPQDTDPTRRVSLEGLRNRKLVTGRCEQLEPSKNIDDRLSNGEVG